MRRTFCQESFTIQPSAYLATKALKRNSKHLCDPLLDTIVYCLPGPFPLNPSPARAKAEADKRHQPVAQSIYMLE